MNETPLITLYKPVPYMQQLNSTLL